MKKIIVLISCVAFLNPLFADEGMWLLTMLNKLNLEAKGSKLTPEQIYSINSNSLKDAIVGLGEADRPFNFFCTAELVSSQGLLFTNYHCAFEMIQKHTSLSNNYIDKGFWAQNLKEELKNDGITATIVKQIIDVSDIILPLYSLGITDLAKQNDTVAKRCAAIAQSVSDTSRYFGAVEGFFENNQYFLFVYEKFEDVRLVGAPPRTIGKFGGDTDNWMWPRHTGDFCVLRIYGNEFNNPAPYSAKNIPINPSHYLPISLKGYEKGDFTMVMGFPGTTNRYMTSEGIKSMYHYNNASVQAIGDELLAVYKQYMDSDSTIRIKYSAKYDRISNYWKYAIGQNKGITDLQVIEQKIAQETEMQNWINQSDERKERYGKILEAINTHHSRTGIVKSASNYMNIGLLNTVELFIFTYKCIAFLEALSSGDAVEIKAQSITMKDAINEHFNNYDIRVDKTQFIQMSSLYKKNVPSILHPGYFSLIDKKYKGNISKYADYVYSKSMFADKQKMLAFIEKPDAKVFLKDPAFELLRNTFPTYFMLQDYKESAEFNAANKLFLEILMKQHPDSLFYPDANSTIRLTYGYVGDYSPRDAVHYNYYTTLKGVIEKENPSQEEFQVETKLKELYTNKNFGNYTNSKGELPLCFITNNDITGGNSGSPVINARGELIGIAFDGNWEAMSGDLIFEPIYQKCIAVDIRYVLFIIDKFAGASHIIEELTITK